MRRLIAVAAFLGAVLAGCAAPTPPPPSRSASAPAPAILAPYQEGLGAGQAVYRLDSAASNVQIFVGRAGPLASAGHLHLVEVSALSGYALLANGAGRADLVFPLNALVVDPPAARAAIGGPYSEPLTPKDRAGTRTNMLGPQSLDSARYPWAHLAVTVPVAAPGSIKIAIALTLHGATRSFPATAELALPAQRLLANGRFTIRQSDFGITPYSALLGALRVADKLDIRYRLVFDRWCPGQPHTSC